MPYRNKQMLRDANGDLIPQYWDVVEQEFKPLTGRDGANDVRLTGSIVEEHISKRETIEPGMVLDNYVYIDVENWEEFRLAFRFYGQTQYDVRITHYQTRIKGNYSSSIRTIYRSSLNTVENVLNDYMMDYHPVYGVEVAIRIENTSSSDSVTFTDVYVTKKGRIR